MDTRLELTSVDVLPSPRGIAATAEIALGGRTASGRAESSNTEPNAQLALVGEAVLSAVMAFFPTGHSVTLERVWPVSSEGDQLVYAKVILSTPEEKRPLWGVAPLAGNTADVAAKAVLSAVNRRSGLFLPPAQPAEQPRKEPVAVEAAPSSSAVVSTALDVLQHQQGEMRMTDLVDAVAEKLGRPIDPNGGAPEAAAIQEPIVRLLGTQDVKSRLVEGEMRISLEQTRAKARSLWSEAEQIVGEGEWATVSYGGPFDEPHLTVYLWSSREEAEARMRRARQDPILEPIFLVHLSEEDRIRELNARFEPAAGDSLPFATLAQAVADIPQEPSWLWSGYVAPRMITLLAGRPKIGKSTLVFSLLAAMQRGQDFLGQATRPAGALVLSEEREDSLSEKVRPDLRASVHVLPLYKAAGYAWPEVVRQAVAYCGEHNLSVLVIDTLAAWAHWKADDEYARSAVAEALRPLKEIAVPAGLAVLILHHQRRSAADPEVGLRGSRIIGGAADILLEHERGSGAEGSSVLKAQSRFATTPRAVTFAMTDAKAASDGHPEATGEAKQEPDPTASKPLA